MKDNRTVYRSVFFNAFKKMTSRYFLLVIDLEQVVLPQLFQIIKNTASSDRK